MLRRDCLQRPENRQRTAEVRFPFIVEYFACKGIFLGSCAIFKVYRSLSIFLCLFSINFGRGSGFFSKLSLEGCDDVYGVFTNNHVLGTKAEAVNAKATFFYEGPRGGETIKLRPEIMFRTHKVSFDGKCEH